METKSGREVTGAGRWEDGEPLLHGVEFLFRMMKKFWKLIVVMVAQHEYT